MKLFRQRLLYDHNRIYMKYEPGLMAAILKFLKIVALMHKVTESNSQFMVHVSVYMYVNVGIYYPSP